MARLFLFAISIGLSVSTHGFLHQYPKFKIGKTIDDNCGEPLFLTKYIESGDIAEGRRLARVPFTESLNITSFTGFFTVNKTYDSNHFFGYFPAINNNTEAPVVVWLQGGPGVSSLFGLFTENGPISIKNHKFVKRKFHWALNHHVIYIDNPVGAGFSFTNNDAGYCTDETQVGKQLYSTIIQFFKIFPELQGNKFYVTGESYAGKYVPALAYTIHKNNPTAALKINLQGLAIGNGWSDPENQLVYGEYLYQLGLIDWNQKQQFEKVENNVKEFIQKQDWINAYNANSFMIMYSFICDLNAYNYINSYDDEDFGTMLTRVIRKDIHVGNLTYDTFGNYKVFTYLKQDFMQSVAPIISELLDHYNILTYNGQLDVIVAYPLTVNYLRHLNFNGSEEYKTAERRIWMVDDEVAGYYKTAGRLVEFMIRNAGHMVPTDQPKWAMDLITTFTHENTFHNP